VNETIKTILLWITLAVILIIVFNSFGPRREAEERITYSTLVKEVKQGKIQSVTISDQNITGAFQNNKSFTTYLPMKQDPALLEDLIAKGVEVKGKPPEPPGILTHL